MRRPPLAHTRTLALLPLIAAVMLSALGARAQEPAPAATTAVYLPLLHGRPAGPQPGRSSLELIDAALERREISAEAALTYKIFAVFGDARLPAIYRGAVPGDGGEEVVRELTTSFATLSPQSQATLRPFTIPPFHQGSWWDLAQRPGGASLAADEGQTRWCDSPAFFPLLRSWKYVDSANGKVRVWWQVRYPQDEANARAHAELVDAMWGELHALMGREPQSDNGLSAACRGGDNRLDVSLIDISDNKDGFTIPYDKLSGATPSFVVVNRTMRGRGARSVIAHELMHAFQFAFAMRGYREYSWWTEATAKWAEHYLDSRLWPNDQHNLEHQSAYSYMLRPELPLESEDGGEDARAGYRSYLFPFFDLIRSGNGAMVRRSFERSERIDDSLEAIDGAVDGGFRKQWPAFALRLINDTPVDDFLRADRLEPRVTLTGKHEVALNGAQDRSYEMDGEVGHLASHTYRYTFSDPTVRSVALVNPYRGGAWPTASMQIVYRANGAWAVEDLTQLNGKSWCRDLKAERVEELYVVIGNSEWQDRDHELEPDKPPRLNATNIACRGWQVQSRVDSVALHFSDERTTETTFATARLERERWEGSTGGIGQLEIYKVVSGDVNWDHKGTFANCTGAQKGSYKLGHQSVALAIHQYALDPAALDYARTRHYYGHGGDEKWKGVQIPYTCFDGRIDMNNTLHGFWFLTGLPAQNPKLIVDPSGTKILGTYRFSVSEEQWHDFTWLMTALPPE